MKFAIDLDDEEVQRLQAAAAASGVSDVDLLRRLVREYFAVSTTDASPPDADDVADAEDLDDGGLVTPAHPEHVRHALSESDTVRLLSMVLGDSVKPGRQSDRITPHMRRAIDQYNRLVRPSASQASRSISAPGVDD
jgi:hypothetical protein